MSLEYLIVIDFYKQNNSKIYKKKNVIIRKNSHNK